MSLSPDSIIATIDAKRFQAIVSKWGLTHTGDERRQKYFDLPIWFQANLRRAKQAGLVDSPPKRVLDLGCGCGYFLYVCKLLGHEAIGIDRPERDSLFVDMRELLGVGYVPHHIRVGEPLPVTGAFDVVAAHMVTFNGHRSENVWGPKEWAWLLNQVPAPVWQIELNLEPDGTLYTLGLREFFDRQGAKVDQHRVLIDQR